MSGRGNDACDCPRLIEVALPIREISAESVRDKSLRHGHISTLHLWWARRPLAASRAVVFASLVPDPDDPRCPTEFRAAVERHLKTNVPAELKYYRRGRHLHRDEDPYRPYEGMPDTLRNRLLMFIAKWSPESLAFEAGKAKKEPDPKYLLDDRSLVKWETSDPENAQGREVLRIARELVKIVGQASSLQNSQDGRPPTVLDPFAGGGAIPLEAGRLGCQPIANDYNPVAYLILRATCEFPQRYGKPGRRKVVMEEFGKTVEREVEVANVLAHDVEKWANWILERARERIGHLYPQGKDGKPVVGYLWARTAPCSNPSCRGEIPLLRSLLVCNKKDKKVALTMEVVGGQASSLQSDRQDACPPTVRFGIAKGNTITRTEGTKRERGPAICPFCGQPTSEAELRRAGQAGQMGERMVAVIVEGKDGKDYRPVEDSDLEAFRKASRIPAERPKELILPEVNADDADDDVSNSTGIRVHLYGMKTWGSLFNPRQLVAMQTFVGCLHEALEEMKKDIEDDEYRKAVGVYLGLWIGRISLRMTNVGYWQNTYEQVAPIFTRQAIPMVWDYPEANPFSESTGGAIGQLGWMLRVMSHESEARSSVGAQLGDAATLSIESRSMDVIVTDPPYFDAIAYGDLSDYFYVWFKRTLGRVLPDVLVTPLTPKGEEATALKHRHGQSAEKADAHFEGKLAEAFRESLRVMKPGGVISIMFAHQSTKAWAALIESLFGAGLAVNASWPIDTERTMALKKDMAALATSITVTCRPRVAGSAAAFKDVRKEIQKVVAESVKRFWSYGFRGADLIVACYGPAVGVFGKYERVEKADGTPVGIPELLELAKQAARDAIAGEFRGDNLSTLYYVWANLYGVSEQSWDDARLVVQIGGDVGGQASSLLNPMDVARGHGIFVVDGSTCRLAVLADREKRRGLGMDTNPPLIDALHRAMLLWKGEKRRELVAYLAERDLLEDGPFWKLAQALFEVLPRDLEDWKLVNALLGERQTLRAEGKRVTYRDAQAKLDFSEEP
jgi:adenine-specific DNA methylase